jgi:hypothetical protein
MSDPLKGRAIHIGGQTRTLRFTFAALRVAHAKFPGVGVRELLENLNPSTVCILAAAGLVHERSVTPERVEKWLDADPERYVDVLTAVAEAFAEGYKRIMPKDAREELEAEEAEAGEASAPST